MMSDDVQPPAVRRGGLPWAIALILIALVGVLGWKAFFSHSESDPAALAEMTFEKQNSLVVLNSRFYVVAESSDARGVLGIDVLKSQQVAIMPAMVDYRIDLAKLGRDRLNWNKETQTLSVRLPQLRISTPNVDESKARVFTDGVWVTAEAQDDLRRNNSAQAERKAVEFAKDPQILALAQQAGKEAIRQNLAIPLEVAGFRDVTVNVRFDGEKEQP